VLLTRSRLCPRPKPGSSLHLHVLGTPPAFVLSQDQTLREELLELTASGVLRHKESSKGFAHEGRSSGPVLADLAPRSHEGSPMYTVGSRSADGVNLGTAV
jgi:hypothetical protein